jgi:hypothetical protein
VNRIGRLLVCVFSAASPALAAAGAFAGKPLVLLISVDRLKSEAVLDAPHHWLKVPNLRAFLTNDVYATGVHGVLPTLTYPSHIMRSSFFMAGPHVALGKSLGEFDMRRIAPTLASVMGVSLPDAELGPLQVR